MVRPALRSHSVRRVSVRTPGQRTVIHYSRHKPRKPHCGRCGVALKGVPHVLSSEWRALPKTAKRPERVYGGVLCSACARRTLIAEARKMNVA